MIKLKRLEGINTMKFRITKQGYWYNVGYRRWWYLGWARDTGNFNSLEGAREHVAYLKVIFKSVPTEIVEYVE